MQIQYIFVDTEHALQEAVAACRKVDAVAIDTEFARFNTYYPIVGLVQIYDGHQCYLVDPLAIGDIAALVPLLEDNSVVKVLHACSEDLEVFMDCTGASPQPIFDSQIAAGLLGVGFSFGYQKLVEHYLNIIVPKEETRSDWLQRPLTESQLQYAALDVVHLLAVYHLQRDELEACDRLAWLQEDCKNLHREIATQVPLEDAWRRSKNLWRLDSRSLLLYKRLATWREETARTENLPRNRVLDDKAMFQIAADMLSDNKAFRDQADMKPRQVRQYGDLLVAMVKAAEAVPESELPASIERSDTPVNSKHLKQLKQLVDRTAKEQGIAPEMLARRRHLEHLLQTGKNNSSPSLPPYLEGWRDTVIGQDLLARAKTLGGDR